MLTNDRACLTNNGDDNFSFSLLEKIKIVAIKMRLMRSPEIECFEFKKLLRVIV